MKTTILKFQNPLKFCAVALFATLTFSSCSNDDDVSTPVNEEELITTVTAIYTPTDGSTAITLLYKDLDGEGANAPVITVSSAFAKNKTYNGTVTFKNELASPTEDITPEIVEEGVDHQLFYQITGSLNAFMYGSAASNFDSNGNPVGLQTVFTTSDAAAGTLTITLRHQPIKTGVNVANGDITNAAGSTDAEVSFPIIVE
ncbi:type 1 periplasmic binding fold superfamily protein [Flavobacterium algicola]|uniref:type 1 periplasmic binding fold superfamily protein n=1 Tax=Flavobacterium algicola TaxID=556529 RepID=UPI001EFCB7FD|nr:type 1 periplasmic binding fold superfamily protein [Flavobacterium algicola]MCG9793382.1 type 1 periplasmic binding fold superfamily protein [Flavobacterium algicola]